MANVTQRQNIPITETWRRTDWSNFDILEPFTTSQAIGYTSDNPGVDPGLSTQKHIDLRTFDASEPWVGDVTYAYGNQSSLNHWPAFICTVPTGDTGITQTFVSTMAPVDLTAIGTNGYITLALSSFPLSAIDLTRSFIDLSSDGFATTICSLPWNTATGNIAGAPVASGNTTLVWPYSALSGLQLQAVTDVRLRITTTTGCTIRGLALRLISPNWVQTNVDFDNLHGRLRQTIPLNGNPTTVVGSNAQLSPLWRSAAIPGSDDPRPINVELGFLINTGSQNAPNVFSLYMRENAQSFVTQQNLNGLMQAQLTGNPQPVFSDTSYVARVMSDMDNLTMGELDTQTMSSLESRPLPGTDHYIMFTLQWGTSSSVTISNSLGGNIHQFGNLGLTPNTAYKVICNLTESSARLIIYHVDPSTYVITQPLYDTTVIEDDYLFPRLAGRIGFQANINDGDAWVGPLRPRSLMFAEYRSKPMNSLTPVTGAQLFVTSSPDVELFTDWSPLSDGVNTPILDIDRQRYVPNDPSGQSTCVTIASPSSATPTQGIISNILSPYGDSISGITDFEHLHIEFYIWMPSNAMTSTINNLPVLTASLVAANGATLPITMPKLQGDQWTTISLLQPFGQPWPVSDLYQLVLNYNGTLGTMWWVGDTTVHESAIGWYGRSVVDDPWRSNYAPWTFFHDTANSISDGVKFSTAGSSVQVRGQAYRQDAVVLSPPTLIPQYGRLGNLVWPENATNILVPPTAATSTTHMGGRTWVFDGRSSTGSTTSNGATSIVNYHWAFGDGTYATGPVVSHSYASWIPGGTQFIVTLVVTDSAGQIAAAPPIQLSL